MKNKWLNLLLVMGTMLSLTPKSKAEEKENGNSFSVNMPYNVNLEKTVDFEPKTGNRFGEVCLKPGFTWQNGDWNGEFRWNAYNSVNEDGTPSGWATTKLFLDIGYKDWKFKGGKWCIDAPDAPFKAFPMTLLLDNQKVAWGQNACFTGFDVFSTRPRPL